MLILKRENMSRSITQKGTYDISFPIGGKGKKVRTIKMFSLLDDKSYY